MSGNVEDHGSRDRQRIDISQEWECRYWREKFSISDDALKQVVHEVGDRVVDVELKLGKSGSGR
jgi:hypothetical protein